MAWIKIEDDLINLDVVSAIAPRGDEIVFEHPNGPSTVFSFETDEDAATTFVKLSDFLKVKAL